MRSTTPSYPFFLIVRRATIATSAAPAAADTAAHAPPPGVGWSDARSSRYTPTRAPAVGISSIGTFSAGPVAAALGPAPPLAGSGPPGAGAAPPRGPRPPRA